jgi:DNA-directed RNA polymerase subunit RPC12/RpoP
MIMNFTCEKCGGKFLKVLLSFSNDEELVIRTPSIGNDPRHTFKVHPKLHAFEYECAECGADVSVELPIEEWCKEHFRWEMSV